MESITLLIAQIIGLILVIFILLNAVHVLLSFFIVNSVLKFMNLVNQNSLIGISIMILLTSIIVFASTYITYLIAKRKKIAQFKRYFKYNYLINLYIWGLLSLLTLIEPSLIKGTLAQTSLGLSNYTSWVTVFIFFISSMNYYIFDTLIINK